EERRSTTCRARLQDRQPCVIGLETRAGNAERTRVGDVEANPGDVRRVPRGGGGLLQLDVRLDGATRARQRVLAVDASVVRIRVPVVALLVAIDDTVPAHRWGAVVREGFVVELFSVVDGFHARLDERGP